MLPVHSADINGSRKLKLLNLVRDVRGICQSEVKKVSEKELFTRFKEHIEKEHPNWKVQSEIPCGELIADGRIVMVDEKGILEGVICYFEIKDAKSDVKELITTGHGQAQYYAEQSGCEAWLVLPHTAITRFLLAKKKLDRRVKLYDLDEQKVIDLETVQEKMSKSRMKRAMERTFFKEWQRTYTIETTTPIGLTAPEYNGDNVLFNLGQRIRGVLKEIMKTESPTLAERIKYSVAVEPPMVKICKKNKLYMTTDYISTERGQTTKRDIYNAPPPIKLTFTIRCLEKTGSLTPEIISHALIKAGAFCGIGDAHSDGIHGRFKLIEGQ
jgi:hypothetical protein